MKIIAAAFFSGILFALGLGVSGMTNANKVIAFLDIAGGWDPSLALVMAGAIAVHLPLQWLIRRRPSPLLDKEFHIPERSMIDARLIAGASLFGAGWALGGYCPGPGIVSLASGGAAPVLFVITMSLGMILFRFFGSR